MKRFLCLFVALLTACAPAYQSSRAPGAKRIVVVGMAVSMFSGPLRNEVIDALVPALVAQGIPANDLRIRANPNATVKLEGDLVAQQSSGYNPSKLEAGTARVIDLRTGQLLVRYTFRAGSALEMRSPEEFAGDLAKAIAKDFGTTP